MRGNRWWLIGVCLAVVVTNRYEGPPADRTFVPGDSYSYLTIAEAAPGLPQEPLPFHHAQRIAIPYLLGMIHHAIPVPVHRLFQISVVLLELAVLFVVAGLLEDISVRGWQATFLLAILALNPWAFRAYLTFPEMINDLGFVLGLAVLLHGLLRGSTPAVLAGVLLASLSRQTGLLLIPMAAVWIWRGHRSWAGFSVPRRLALCLAIAVLAVGVYAATARLAESFSDTSENAVHIYGMVNWVTTEFDGFVLARFLLRAAVAPAILLMLLLPFAHRLGAGKHDAIVPILLFGSLSIWAQPLLAGPEITGGNGPRLGMLGLLPLFLVLAMALRDAGAFTGEGASRRASWIVAFAALASLHHLYVFAQVPSPVQRALFGVTYLLACAGIYWMTRLDAQSRQWHISSTP